MIDELKRIESDMLSCVTESDNEGAHIDADQLMADLALALSARCYDEEKACVERILGHYTPATKGKWWHRD